jgi:hypothetical protein
MFIYASKIFVVHAPMLYVLFDVIYSRIYTIKNDIGEDDRDYDSTTTYLASLGITTTNIIISLYWLNGLGVKVSMATTK